MTDASSHYLDEKLDAAPPELELALAFVPPERVPRARLLHALRIEFEELLFAPRDGDVLLARVGWWREEWGRLVAGRPRHPLTSALRGEEGLAGDQLDPLLGTVLEQLGSGTRDLAAVAAASAALGTVLAGIDRAPGALARDRAADRAMDGPAAVWTDLVRSDWILGFPLRLQAQQESIPLDLAAVHQLTRRDVLAEPAAEQRLLAALHGSFPADPPPPAADAWVYGALRRLTLQRRVEARGEAGALRRLVTAWRAARAVRASPPVTIGP